MNNPLMSPLSFITIIPAIKSVVIAAKPNRRKDIRVEYITMSQQINENSTGELTAIGSKDFLKYFVFIVCISELVLGKGIVANR